MTYYAKVVNGLVEKIVSSSEDFTQLQPYQQEMWVKMSSRDAPAKKRFQLIPDKLTYGFHDRSELGLYSLMIEDYVWWTDNERDILNWMVDHLPHGIEHQQGMMVYLPTDEDRVLFLLRWGG